MERLTERVTIHNPDASMGYAKREIAVAGFHEISAEAIAAFGTS